MTNQGAYLTTVSDAPSCGITYDHYSDDTRGAIYDRNIFMIQVTGLDRNDNEKQNSLLQQGSDCRF